MKLHTFDIKIKKIIVRDPNFYMDVTNVIDWNGNNYKDEKIIDIASKVIKNPKLYSTFIDGSNTVCTTLINRKQMRTFSRPIVTGGFSNIDPNLLILTSLCDANTEDKVEQKVPKTFSSINDMFLSEKLIKDTYNEVTSRRFFINNGVVNSQKFNYMVICPNSSWKHTELESTLEWAYIFDVPIVEIDSKFMYNYSEKELEQLVSQLYQSPNMITFQDFINMITLFSSLNSFLSGDEYTKYCFTDIMDYVINWENKEHSYETLEELEKIFKYIKTFNSDINPNLNMFLDSDIKYNFKEIEEICNNPIFKKEHESITHEKSKINIAKNKLIEIKRKEKNNWMESWLALIRETKEKLTENNRKLGC